MLIYVSALISSAEPYVSRVWEVKVHVLSVKVNRAQIECCKGGQMGSREEDHFGARSM